MRSSDSNQSSDSDREREAERFVPDRDGPELAYEHVHRYLLAAKLLKGLRVLDLAAGSGYGALLMEEAGCRMTTLDLDPKSLRRNHSGVCADAQSLPLRNESFDAVVCFEAIEHVANPEALVQEVQRVLCGRSIFLVSTPDRTIYRDRAGHQNPYHLAEMERAEFTALLEQYFEYVRLSGQGLWAGSWITSLDDDNSGSALQRRKVDATRWEGDRERASDSHARWASPEKDELPVPVYLLAACSNSTKGWNIIKRKFSTDSVLHDSSQWLLAQYERLVEEGTGRNEELEGQIDRARLEQGDLLEQLRAARTTIDEQASLSEAARSSMRLLEEEIRASKLAADRQFDELQRARSASKKQGEQLSLARDAQDDLQNQLAIVARASADHADEIARARETIDQQHQRLEGAKSGAKDMESQIEAARSGQLNLQTQLEAARSEVADLEAQVDAARSTNDDLQTQVTRARAAIDEKDRALVATRAGSSQLEEEIARARETIDQQHQRLERAKFGAKDMESQIEAARSAVADLETHLVGAREEFSIARSSILGFESELEAARRGAADMERQIDNARTLLEDKERTIDATRRAIRAREIEIGDLQAEAIAATARIDDLECANARLWSRIGHRLADWFSRSDGSG